MSVDAGAYPISVLHRDCADTCAVDVGFRRALKTPPPALLDASAITGMLAVARYGCPMSPGMSPDVLWEKFRTLVACHSNVPREFVEFWRDRVQSGAALDRYGAHIVACLVGNEAVPVTEALLMARYPGSEVRGRGLVRFLDRDGLTPEQACEALALISPEGVMHLADWIEASYEPTWFKGAARDMYRSAYVLAAVRS